MLQRAVVRKDQHARRIDIETANGLHVAAAKRTWQQRHDGGMSGRLHRALVARRLVERNDRLLKVRPVGAEAAEDETFGLDVLVGIVVHFGCDFNGTGGTMAAQS